VKPFEAVEPPAELVQALARLGTRLRAFLWFSAVTSTNDVVASLAERGADEGVVAAAEMQTAGRGRIGRTWMSPPGAGVYASVLFRPPADVAPLLTLAAGVAMAEGIAGATGLVVDLKWPNDLVIGRRKLGGILAEAGTPQGGPPHVVVGFGINVLPAALPAEIADRATSIEAELGRPVDRGAVLAECLAALWSRYEDLRGGRGGAVLTAWRARGAATFGRVVEWDEGGRVRRGIAVDIDAAGALLVRSAARLERVIAGEVRWR
jgi:BirA family biotin operon repressor/biotin-[acetyl-CoA-carboxylase] ligase